MAGGLCAFAEHGCGFVAMNTSTPLAALLIFVGAVKDDVNDNMKTDNVHIQVGLGNTDRGSKFPLIPALDVWQDDNGHGLLVDDGSEASFALDNDIGDAHLAAQGREEDELNGVDVVGNDNEGSLLRLYKCNDVVKTVFGE